MLKLYSVMKRLRAFKFGSLFLCYPLIFFIKKIITIKKGKCVMKFHMVYRIIFTDFFGMKPIFHFFIDSYSSGTCLSIV